MEIGTRKGPKDFLAGLGRCVEKDSTISAAEKTIWQLTKHNTRRLFDPALGKRYEVFNKHPIQAAIAKNCTGDITLLPNHFNTHNIKLYQPSKKI
jgi:exonuclease 3'-5' domain-containing protein 1